MQCDMCGKEAKLVTAIVEGTELNVCSECAVYGKVLKKPIIKPAITRKRNGVSNTTSSDSKPNIVQEIVLGYGKKIRTKREQMGLKQEELARMLALKTSMIQNIENEKFEPRIDTLRKLEKKLHIKLIEQVEEKKPRTQTTSTSQSLTLGDLLSSHMRTSGDE